MNDSTLDLKWNPDAVSVKGLSLSIGGKHLVENTNLELSKGQRICLLGRNGSGKSTLFNWLATKARHFNIWSSYLVEQELPPCRESALQMTLAADIERGQLWARRAEFEIKMEELGSDGCTEPLSDDEFKEYQAVCEELRARRADADEPVAAKILRGLGFSEEQMRRPLCELSGGWRARVALARGLFMKPQLLMLDEPTNHIDLAGAVWLSEFCKEWPTTLAVITHNAHFVGNVCSGIWDLKQKGVRSYKCSYNMYMKQLASDSLASASAWEKVEKQVAAWRSKGTPAASKLADDFLAKKAAEVIRKPDRGYAPRFLLAEHATTDSREKTSIISMADATAKYTADGPAVLRGVEFALYNGSRVSLVGANGAGKSTFLKMLTGELDPVEGVVQRKNGLRVAFFHQHFFHDLPQEMSAATYIRSEFEKTRKGTGINTTEEEVRKLLGTTGMESSTHTIDIRHLSGGQKARVYFAGIAASAPELLVLDEPSNHLDMETAQALLDALKAFPGAVVIVSHDLSFLEELDPDVWLCDGGKVEHLGHGDAALNKYIEDTLKEPEAVEPPARTPVREVAAAVPEEEAARKEAKRRAMLNKFFDSEKRKRLATRAKRLEEEEEGEAIL